MRRAPARDCPLPFIWYKPIELYAPVLDMPNAVPPRTLDRDDGPTIVAYRLRRGTAFARLGVSDWPAVGRTFQFIPYDARVTPKQGEFNRLLDRLGTDRTGFDAEHVWDVYLRGLTYDRFSNLWPASRTRNSSSPARGTASRSPPTRRAWATWPAGGSAWSRSEASGMRAKR